VLVAASPALLRAFSFGVQPGSLQSAVIAVACGALLGAIGGGLQSLPATVRRMIFTGVIVVLLVALFRDILASFLQSIPGLRKTTRAIF
ncbi:hypothetical protein ACJEKK_25490, partial [Escherichia coli]